VTRSSPQRAPRPGDIAVPAVKGNLPPGALLLAIAERRVGEKRVAELRDAADTDVAAGKALPRSELKVSGAPARTLEFEGRGLRGLVSARRSDRLRQRRHGLRLLTEFPRRAPERPAFEPSSVGRVPPLVPPGARWTEPLRLDGRAT